MEGVEDAVAQLRPLKCARCQHGGVDHSLTTVIPRPTIRPSMPNMEASGAGGTFHP